MSDIVTFLRYMAEECDEEYYRMGEAADEIERLKNALAEAREDLGNWAAYAPDYFQEKWDLAGDLARIDAELAK